MPKISVVMSVYNEPKEWLGMAIQSILDQTYADFEFIIVNDNPNNANNRQLLDEFATKDSRISIIANENNIGLTKSLNKAIRLAQGQFIARMDADDMSLPQRFARQVEYLDTHSNILALGSWTGSIDQDGNRLDSIGRYETDFRWVRAQFIQNSQISHPAVMFHRIINGELVQYDESVRYAQDYSLMVNILQYGEIANIPEVLFCYRHSDSQITSSKRAEQQACAFKAQRRAFALFGFNTSDEFLELFHQLTIRHDMDIPLETVTNEFEIFFKANCANQNNRLALELIVSTYLAYLSHQHANSRDKALLYAAKHSTNSMKLLGIRLFVDLIKRKITRAKHQ